MNKETKELKALLGSATNSVYETTADKKVDLTDLGNWFDTIGLGQEGFKGVGLIGSELATATIQEKEENRQAFDQELTDVNQEDRYDLTNFIHGVFSGWSFVARKAYEKGQSDLIAKLKSGERRIEDL